MERRHRVAILLAVALLSAAVLAGQGLTAAPPTTRELPEGDDGAYPGYTLIGLQAKGWFGNNNGTAILVSPKGEVVWRYDPPNSRVFDVELLENGNVLASVATVVPAENCPDEYTGRGVCVHNRVLELDMGTKEPVWKHTWYDAYPTHHEVHDADRLPSGETAIIDMGNNRAFTVAQNGSVTWSWQAEQHIGEGTQFWKTYVPEDQESEFRKQGPESDWTHMNDIDLLANGHFTLSIRNFDTVLEVARNGSIVGVYGAPGKHSVMNEQHNPNMLEERGTMLIADSENDRVVEIDVQTEEIIWKYDGTGSGQHLQWPRDADRLPNGNTLITDSRNFRVIEVNPNGTVVWQYAMPKKRGIMYEADRVHLPENATYIPEEPDDVPSGRNLEGRSSTGPLDGFLATVESWASFVFPYWMGLPEILTLLVGLLAAAGALWEGRKLRG